jgi:hypothetical protein
MSSEAMNAIEAAKAAQQAHLATAPDYLTAMTIGPFDPTNSNSITVDSSQVSRINAQTWTITKDESGNFYTNQNGLLLENFILSVDAAVTVIHRNGNRSQYQTSNLVTV